MFNHGDGLRLGCATPVGRPGLILLLGLLALMGALVIGCGGEEADIVDALEDTRTLGPLTELPLLEGHNHSSETCVAARNGRVVVALINQALVAEDSFEYPSGVEFRHVGVLWSVNRGETFSANIELAPADVETSDPVVRVDAAGVFWATALDVDSGRARVFSSSDDGASWPELPVDVPVNDKEWLVIDDQDDVIYVQGRAGVYEFDREGTVLATASYQEDALQNAVSGYASDGGAYFLTMGRRVIGWDGTGEPMQVGPQFYSGNLATIFTVSAGSIGVNSEGVHWLVRAVHDTSGSPVLLGLAESPGGPYLELAISPDDAVTFLPAADVDAHGRLHAIWYDSSGEKGVLRYTHSASSDLAQGFLPPIVVDDDACPGQGWYPYSSGQPPPGGRRLREYIDISIDGSRAHIAWTHAPEPPARVYATYVDF